MKKKVKIEKVNSKSLKEKLWIAVAIISMTVYIVWRIFFTIPDRETYGLLALICGIFLVVSETVSMLEGTEHFFRLSKKLEPDMPKVPHEKFPHVDVLIATHNEEVDLLYKTINGCKHMEYPDKKKVHIYVCDDNNRPEMAELAKRMGVGYFGLAENKHAKAGNLNNALSQSNSPWVVTFDADMIPTHDFLMETVPYTFLPVMKKLDDGTWAERTEEEIDPKFKLGFIQTPQSFYNADLFQYNFYSEQRIPNEQDYFFREINVGRNNANAPIYAGSNTLISRQALEEVEGIAIDTITEDFETGIRIQAKGYTCYAVDKTLAHGLAPTDIDSLIKQRTRWGRGCIHSLRQVNILFNPDLKLNTKMGYIACWLYWWTFFRRFIFLLSPIIFILFNIPVVICGLWELLLIWLPSFLLYNHALNVSTGKIRNKKWSNTVDTVIFPYMVLPILMETLFIRQKKFIVTNKQRVVSEQNNMQLALPHIILLCVDVLALVIATIAAFRDRNFGAAVVIYWLATNALHLIMAVFFMAGRPNMRVNDRFFVQLPVQIEYMDKYCYGDTMDLSETGLSIRMDDGRYLPHGEENMRVRLKTDRYNSEFTARCVRAEERDDKSWKYGLQIREMDEENKSQYFQILYDRDHSLAKIMKFSTSSFDDIFLNIQRRTAAETVSRRRMPRIVLEKDLQSSLGYAVHVIDCSYEYVMVRANTALPERLELFIPDSEESLKLKAVAGKDNLYQVENWRELLYQDAFEKLFGMKNIETAASAE